MKQISRTVKSTLVNVIGINPAHPTETTTVPYQFNGGIADLTDKEKERIKKTVSSAEFIPALVMPTNEETEFKYAMSLEDFIAYSHVYAEGEKLTDCITRTVSVVRLTVYGVNPSDLSAVQSYNTVYGGDYEKASSAEIRKIMDECRKSDFYPAYIVPTTSKEVKRVIKISDFMRLAHIVENDEVEED